MFTSPFLKFCSLFFSRPIFFSFPPYFLVFLPILVSVLPSHSYFYFRFYLYSVSIIHIFHSSKMLSFYFYSSHYFRSLSMLRGRVGRVGRSHPKSTFVLFFCRFLLFSFFFKKLRYRSSSWYLFGLSSPILAWTNALRSHQEPNLLTAPHGVEHLAQAYSAHHHFASPDLAGNKQKHTVDNYILLDTPYFSKALSMYLDWWRLPLLWISSQSEKFSKFRPSKHETNPNPTSQVSI